MWYFEDKRPKTNPGLCLFPFDHWKQIWIGRTFCVHRECHGCQLKHREEATWRNSKWHSRRPRARARISFKIQVGLASLLPIISKITPKKILRSQPETAKIAFSSLSVFILLKQMIFMKTSAPIAQRSPRSGSPGGSIVDGKAGPHLGAVPMIVVINGCYPLIILGGAHKIAKFV